MDSAEPGIRQGTICWAEVPDHNDVRKRRPVLVITADDEIILDEPIVVVAITTTFPPKPAREFVELPWMTPRHPRTGLAKRSAAKCDWLVEIRPSDVLDIVGFLPTKHLLRVVERVSELQPPEREDPR